MNTSLEPFLYNIEAGIPFRVGIVSRDVVKRQKHEIKFNVHFCLRNLRFLQKAQPTRQSLCFRRPRTT